MALLFLILAFTGAFVTVLLALWIVRKLLDRDDAGDIQGVASDGDTPLLLRGDELSTISPWRKLLEQFDFIEKLKRRIDQADLAWSVGRVTLLMLLSGAVALVALSKLAWLPFWAKAAGALLIAFLPYGYILGKRDRRLHSLEDQVPDALDSLARALRAGYPFTAALEHIATQTPQPLGKELRQTAAEGALGMPWERALDNLTRRVPLGDVHVFVAAVQMQSRTGGNLSEILDKLSENMREAAAIRGEVRSLSAQGRMAGRVLTVVPIFIAGVMVMVNPTFLNPLLEDRTGRNLLAASALGVVAAHFVIRKIVDIRL
jgi:tight adherence protein B